MIEVVVNENASSVSASGDRVSVHIGNDGVHVQLNNLGSIELYLN